MLLGRKITYDLFDEQQYSEASSIRRGKMHQLNNLWDVSIIAATRLEHDNEKKKAIFPDER